MVRSLRLEVWYDPTPRPLRAPNELVLTDEIVPELRTLVDAVHSEGAAISAQLAYAGAVAASAGIRAIALVAMGRGLLRDPDLVNQMQRGEIEESLCIHCNQCMAMIYEGTHCVLLPEDRRA